MFWLDSITTEYRTIFLAVIAVSAGMLFGDSLWKPGGFIRLGNICCNNSQTQNAISRSRMTIPWDQFDPQCNSRNVDPSLTRIWPMNMWPASSPGSSRLPIWLRQERRPWGRVWYVIAMINIGRRKVVPHLHGSSQTLGIIECSWFKYRQQTIFKVTAEFWL